MTDGGTYHAESKYIPNSETIAAIEEIRNGKYAGELDMSSYDAFMKSINSSNEKDIL